MTSPYPRSRPYDSIDFRRHEVLTPWYYSTWPFGEIHLFESKDACLAFAKKHALRVTFLNDEPEEEPPTEG